MNTLRDTHEIKGKNVLIVGYGKEGESVHRYIARVHPDIHVSIADKKSIEPTAPVVSVYTGDQWLRDVGQFDTIVHSPGVSKDLPELQVFVKRGGWITSSTNIFFSRIPPMVIGVTGTKGKSTTTSLIGHILSQKYNDVRVIGNIGKPALDYCEGETSDTIYVFELSSHQLSDARYSPNIAVILPIVPEHLDYYDSFEAYWQAKAHIVAFQQHKDVVVYNNDNTITKKIAETSSAKKILYSPDAIEAGIKIKLQGNTENISAAVATCSLFDLSKEEVWHGVETFVPLPHRLEFVGEYKHVRFYNDSLSTIPEALMHAVQALGSDTETLIVGGYDRGVSYANLGAFLNTSSVKTLILMGKTGKKIKDALGDMSRVVCVDASTMEEAVRLAYTHTAAGKICALSPASTSFDQFKDYKDRGEQFISWVKKVASE